MISFNLPLTLSCLFSLLVHLPITSAAPPTCTLSKHNTSSALSGTDPGPGTSTGGSSVNGNSTSSAGSSLVAAAWWENWMSAQFPLEDVSWEKYSHVLYSFLVTQADGLISVEGTDTTLLPQFVELAHANGTNAMLSVGGWGGSVYFSSSVGSAANRTAFARSVLSVISQYALDGVEFDWEYPGGGNGIGCNVNSTSDTANFLLFLQELRAQSNGSSLVVSAAVADAPFADASDDDIAAFAEVLDYIEMMNYDVWGSFSQFVGPNSPLADACAPYQDGSATSGVQKWTAAGFPANQILLGVASYGHSFLVSQANALTSSSSSSSSSSGNSTSGTLTLYPSFEQGTQPQGDSWDVSSAGTTDVCGNSVAGSGFSGIWDFWGLVQEGWLEVDTTGTNVTAKEGIDWTYDECSQTPFVYNPTSQIMVSYDDPTSFAAKGQFIVDQGLAGFAMWQAGGDYQDMLLDSINGAMGVDTTICDA